MAMSHVTGVRRIAIPAKQVWRIAALEGLLQEVILFFFRTLS